MLKASAAQHQCGLYDRSTSPLSGRALALVLRIRLAFQLAEEKIGRVAGDQARDAFLLAAATQNLGKRAKLIPMPQPHSAS